MTMCLKTLKDWIPVQASPLSPGDGKLDATTDDVPWIDTMPILKFVTGLRYFIFSDLKHARTCVMVQTTANSGLPI